MDFHNYREGIARFNRGLFFEAHEVLEDVWRAAPQAEKKFLQGLIQAAVGLHHYSRGNLAGARSLLLRAHNNLVNYGGEHGGINLAALRSELNGWRDALGRGVPPPAFPQMEMAANKDPEKPHS